jgi:CBS domain-containing protein
VFRYAVLAAIGETRITTMLHDYFLRGLIMKVANILRIKGSAVKTVRPDETALGLSHKLRTEGIGAMVVSKDGRSIDGIISERDLAYGLVAHGSQLPRIAVAELMTKVVIVCSPEDSITDVIKLMTRRRIRHLPVKDGDQLVGIISIGDVLKHRLGELQTEANVLRDYRWRRVTSVCRGRLGARRRVDPSGRRGQPPRGVHRPKAFLMMRSAMRGLSPRLGAAVNSSHPSSMRTRAADRLLLGMRDAAPEVAADKKGPSPR